MKKCISIIAFAVLIFMGANPANAQQKIAHLNLDSLVLLMPEKIKADSSLEKFRNTYQKALEQKEKEYYEKEAQIRDLEAANNGVPPTDNPNYTLLVGDIQTLVTTIRSLEQTAQTDINKQTQKLYEPIIKKAQNAINAVAKEKGYTYVINSSVGALLVSPDADNIFEDVKKKLGIK